VFELSSGFQSDLVITRLSWVYASWTARRPIIEQLLRKSLAGERVEMPDGAEQVNDWAPCGGCGPGNFSGLLGKADRAPGL
jgi:hypothetical protein